VEGHVDQATGGGDPGDRLLATHQVDGRASMS
jgi:hypothetical protein